MIEPSFQHLIDWLQEVASKQPDKQYDFVSSTNCLVAHYIKQNWDPKEDVPPRFDKGEWSSIFPGEKYEDRLRTYHRVCDAKPYTYAGALVRMEEEVKKWNSV